MQKAFKFYKTKATAPDLTNVIDCTDKDNDKVVFLFARFITTSSIFRQTFIFNIYR